MLHKSAGFLYPVSFSSAFPGLLTVPASTVSQAGKKLLLTLPQVVGRGNDVKANITTEESPQTENQNYSSNAGPAGRKRDRKGHLDQPLLRADKEQLS